MCVYVCLQNRNFIDGSMTELQAEQHQEQTKLSRTTQPFIDYFQ